LSKLSPWIIVGVIAGVPLILFWPLLIGGRVLYWGTPILQFYEWRQLVVEAYRAGHFPLWTEALGCGAPLLANLQSAALYPLNLIYLVFPIERAMGYSIVIHVILAGLFMYGFARNIGLRRMPSVIAALSYMLSGFMISRAQFLSLVNCAAWLPLLFWLTHRVMRKQKVTDVLLLGLVIAAQLLAGHAQLWYYSLWAIGLYALFLGGRSILHSLRSGNPFSEPGSRQAWVSLGLMLLSLVVGVLAAAGQILPTVEMTSFSQRAAGAEFDFAMNYSFWPWRLITLFSPDFFGNPADGNFWGYGNYWEDCGYIGLLPLILGLAAIVIWLHRRPKSHSRALSQVPFFAALSVVALLLAMGKNLPVYPFIWRYVPGFDLFQAPSRFLYWYTFGMAVLAGIGLQCLTPSERWARFSRYLIAVSLSVLLTVGIGWAFLAGSTKLTFLGALTNTSVLAIAAGALILLNTRWVAGRQRKLWNVLVVGIILVDLLMFGWPLNPTAGAGVYQWASDSGSFLRHQQPGDAETFRIFSFFQFYHETMFDKFFGFKDFGPRDNAHLRELRETLLPNLSVIEDLDSANNYDPLLVGNHQDLLEYVEDLPEPEAFKLLGLMNVRYVVGDQETTDGTPLYSDQVDIFANVSFLPRAYVVYRERVVRDQTHELAVLSGENFDPEQQVLLSSPGHTVPTARSEEVEEPPSAVVPLRYEENSVTMDVILDWPGYLVLADTYYPAWRAMVDGEEQPILRANYSFRAIALPAGKHHVVFQYDPLSFRIGLWVGGLTWLCVVVALVVLVKRERLHP
jgi:hypothetical protein